MFLNYYFKKFGGSSSLWKDNKGNDGQHDGYHQNPHRGSVYSIRGKRHTPRKHGRVHCFGNGRVILMSTQCACVCCVAKKNEKIASTEEIKP